MLAEGDARARRSRSGAKARQRAGDEGDEGDHGGQALALTGELRLWTTATVRLSAARRERVKGGPIVSDQRANYDPYAAIYDEHTLGVTGDVAFYRALALEAGGPIVEVGVGTGRIALPIAEAGVPVIGMDLSRSMLAVAREKARAVGPAVSPCLALVQADMRRWALRRPVALVTIPFRTFLHNMTTEDQLATLECARAALLPGGRLALNVFNPDIAWIAETAQAGGSRRRPLPGAVEEEGSYEPTAQIARTTWSFRQPGGRVVRFSFALRYIYRYEMEHLLARAGFVVEALFGDHIGSVFEERSTEMVWIARRQD